MAVTSAGLEILVRVLATTDPVWFAPRNYGGHEPANLFAARQSAPGGIAPPVPPDAGSDAASKMSRSRTMAGLESAGLIVAVRGKGRVTHVRLTDAGEDLARAVAGRPSLADAVTLSRSILESVPHHLHELTGEKLYAESDIVGIPWGGGPTASRAYANLESDLVPALRRGWLVAHSDGSGRAFYSFTADGLTAIAKPVPKKPKATKGKKAVPELVALYVTTLRAEAVRLETAVPSTGTEMGELPLSESHGERYWPDGTEVEHGEAA
jgi:hypothetical protein